ncbi:hypothetical protein BGZ63DRAFT_373724 [Mariannaea sp. PMI_226]|nr:hypothetical protein BGZ63DRAFT_373724 [Mariannaea sp. PMI_226]
MGTYAISLEGRVCLSCSQTMWCIGQIKTLGDALTSQTCTRPKGRKCACLCMWPFVPFFVVGFGCSSRYPRISMNSTLISMVCRLVSIWLLSLLYLGKRRPPTPGKAATALHQVQE